MARNQLITSEDDSSSEVATRDDLPITINLPETSRPPTPPTEQRRKKKPALEQLKQNVKKTKEGKKMKRAKQNQKPEQSTEIGIKLEEEMWPQQEAEPKIKEKKQDNEEEVNRSEQNPTTMIDTTNQNEVQQPLNPPRRGNRNRLKTDFFGNNIMISQITNSPRREEENDEN